MQLYFVRHGKTKWNLEGRYQGGSGNSPLLPESYEDIKKLAKALNSEKARKFIIEKYKGAVVPAF